MLVLAYAGAACCLHACQDYALAATGLACRGRDCACMQRVSGALNLSLP
jgi:hypothetical protein